MPIAPVFVDYPPTAVTEAGELAATHGGRVLLIEDDVVSGVSLELAALAEHGPASVAVYLGRRLSDQFPENVPPGVTVFVAEAYLNPADRARHETNFVREFGAGE